MPAVSGSSTQVATYAATAIDLAGAPDDQFKEGDLGWVASLGRHFVLQRGVPPFAANNTTLVSTYSGNGYWMLDGSPGEFWGGVADWYISGVSGLDTNAGNTAAAPLKTFAELARRLSGAINPVVATVHVLSTTPNTDPPTFTRLPELSFIRVVSGTQTVLATGPITFVQPFDPATNKHLEITSAAFAGHALKLVRITASANPSHVGAYGYLVYDLGANKMRTTQFTEAYPSELYVVPSVGDTIEVLDVPTIGAGTTDSSIAYRIQFALLNLSSEFRAYFDPATPPGTLGYRAGVRFFGCSFTPGTSGGQYGFIDGYHQIQSSLIWGIAGGGGLFTGVIVYVGELELRGSAIYGDNGGWVSIGSLFAGANIICSDNTLFQSANGVVDVWAGGVIDLSDTGIYDCNDIVFNMRSDSTLRVSNWSFSNTGYVYGTGNTKELIVLRTSVRGSYLNKAQLVATTGTGTPLVFAGKAPIAWAALPAVNTALATDNQAVMVAQS